jgi:hypothetical protein
MDHAAVVVDLAEVLRMAGRPEETNVVLRRALDLFQRKGDIVSAASVQKALAELW